jgi:ABC-type transport system involved in cytochrome bd biosynthesis fused ATPase/permease subunit
MCQRKSKGQPMQSIAQELIQRKSPRLKEKNREGKIITKLAQDLIAKKCGIISEEGNLEDLTLQQYLDLYKKPLSEPEMEAIMELTKVAKEMKKKRLHKNIRKIIRGTRRR